MTPHPEERAPARVSKDGPRKERRHTSSFSRHEMPEFLNQTVPPRNRGRREDRAPAGTHGPRAAKKHAAEPQVQPKSPGLPCAMVLRLIRDLPGETGLCCHRCLASSRKAQHLHRGARTTRFRRPHHAVRLTTQRGHRIPLPTFVTIDGPHQPDQGPAAFVGNGGRQSAPTGLVGLACAAARLAGPCRYRHIFWPRSSASTRG
jgi:hypothetical protein